MNNKELVMNVRKAVDGNLEATFKLMDCQHFFVQFL